ncbi:HlyD family efflux transporter periplasmic adaptor subunit [Paracraurococcus lichenis]|uniref:HlyD family efflux transporter periplasmic adaptor subunit n=1 Tax=Paracraurococcus lichenis TaxID=3064888 RepID=A0ABT9DZF5_9PROT|nr:HlyD family efflux transporter periplasmic adaptor subunit [Paracraurococcus sp. LOR1-02]MDO9709263.1 HlyD family efflux transporter periplasmic adaptor subunit [Paracraurococcus sp. LOR1-02]
MTVPATRPLFRQEVLEFQQLDRQWGRAVPMQPVRIRLTVWFIISAAAAIVAFLFLAQYARKETVAGYLMPAAGTARVFPTQSGIVSTLLVEQGQAVEEGQPLLSITTTQIAVTGEDVNATILASLAQQKESLNRQIATEQRRIASERDRLTAMIQGLETELGHLNAQIAVQRERIRVVERILASGQQLAARGLVSELDQRRREEALLEQRQALNALAQQLTARQSQLTETRFSLEQLPFVEAEKIQSMRNEMSTIEQRIAEVDGRRAYVIRAPMTGRISSLQATVGQPANPQNLLLQIIPAHSPLRAELFIPARAIGFVEVGQPVRILYDAFPYQHFGTYRGRIEKVSATILTATDVTLPVALKEPAYRATVSLERPDVDAYGKKVPLQPDMLLRADIILERRTLVDWILNPLLSARIQG